jgi:hypothetical protein
MRFSRFFSVASIAVVFLSACGDDEADAPNGFVSGDSTVFGTLTEWDVQVDRDSIGAGEVVFSMTNEGSIVHEFVVVKTEIADGKIPLDGDRFDEGLTVSNPWEKSRTLSSGRRQSCR